MRFTEVSNTKLTEAFDNPYPFKLTGPSESQGFVATAQTPNGVLRADFETTDYDNFGIDFAVGKSMGKTDAGDEFRVFATVVAMTKKWINTVGIEHVESFEFGANKSEHASDGRARLYTRFAKQLASKLGWKLEQSTTGNGSTAFFRLTNPKPIPRDDEYWDALEESVNENISALQSELEQKYNLKSLFLSDMASRNAIELHSIIVNKEEQGSGTGSKVMQEIIAYADANDKIVVLDPGLLDKQHGTTSQSRLRKFYKRFGFIDNKGRNKNYVFRNLMIRYPQTNEAVNEAEDTLTLPKIKVGDEVMVGKFKNRKAEVKGFTKDDHNQPVLKTTKGDQKLFKPRISKLMKTEAVNEGYKLQLERDADMMVLNITDTVTGMRTEVRGKAGYETNGYDANDKLHQLLDKISKTANISELMNGEPVGINPKHPDGASAKSATDTAFNEETGAEMLSIFQKMHHDAGNNDEMDAFIQSHDWKLRDFTPDMFPSEEEFFDYDDPFGRIIDIDYYHRVDLSKPIIVGPQYSDGKYSVIDGNHRAAQAQASNKTIKGYFPVKKATEAFTDTAFNEAAGVGRVVKGVNTTVDVGVDEIIKQVKKFGNDVDRDGIPTKKLKTK